GQNGVVAAARAPTYVLGGGEVLLGEFLGRNHFSHGCSRLQNLLDAAFQLVDGEGLAIDLREALRRGEEPGAEQREQLPHVHLSHEHLVELLQQLAQVLGEGVEIAQVRVGNTGATGAAAAYRLSDCTVRRAPAEDE